MALVAELRGELVAALAELERARDRIAELEAQVGQNSQNSSRPPSSDGLAKPAPRSLRERGKRKPGGQQGHPGATLNAVAVPDREVPHEPACCSGCGAGLADRPVTGVVRRQVFDLPPVAVRVSEHQLIERECGCGVRTRGRAPDGIDAPVQYGPRIAAIVVYLYVGQFLSRARTAAALAELFGTPISAGTVASMTARAARKLSGFAEVVAEQITRAPAAHFDETGFRVAGALRWVHSASTGKYVLITVHDKRGVKAMDAAGVLPHFTGIAHHDAWAPYDTYTHMTHALCNAHLLRELAAVTDHSAAGSWCWAEQAAEALRELKHLVDAAHPEHAEHADLAAADPAQLAEAISRYRSAAAIGASQTAPRATKLMAKHHALARRMIDRQDDYLRFTHDPHAAFDNNAAEREIRMIKLRQKVSGCLRTLTGAEQFCAIRSYLATAAKHGIHFFESLVALTTGHPWLPEPA